MTGEPERGNGLPVGLERGNVLGLVPNVLAGLVTNHEVSNGIQYSYASHPCSHVSLETFTVGNTIEYLTMFMNSYVLRYPTFSHLHESKF